MKLKVSNRDVYPIKRSAAFENANHFCQFFFWGFFLKKKTKGHGRARTF
jgi:hypothetical protein